MQVSIVLLGRRIAAYFVDVVILFVVLAPAGLLIQRLLGLTPRTGPEVARVILWNFSVPAWLYFMFGDHSKAGATPGKWLLKIRVTDTTGERVSLRRVLLRTAIKLLPWEDAGAGNLHARAPAVLIARRHDGSGQTFVGCYVTHASNLRPSDNPGAGRWRINGASLAPASDGAAIPSLLARVCGRQPAPAYDNPISPDDLLASFYNAINRQEYRRAYGYWETPPINYDAFVRGYQETASVQLIVEPPVDWDTGNDDVLARIPTVLIATHRDGSRHTTSGCYVARQPNQSGLANGWRILPTMRMTPAPPDAVIPRLLAQAC